MVIYYWKVNHSHNKNLLTHCDCAANDARNDEQSFFLWLVSVHVRRNELVGNRVHDCNPVLLL